IEQLFDAAVSALHMPDDFTVEGLTPDNAYLHIQGHQLYKLVRHIGTLLCKGTGVAFTGEILNTARQVSGYEEIDCVQSDLKTILS
ncbi:MAG: hypothetical protein K2K77_02895, partial [Duncaniella sp.]|nr:hypothetical protein [Duncaniella sp.]